MDIQSPNTAIVKTILHFDKDKFIQKEKVDFWNELSISEQEEIEKGIKELNEEKRVEFNDFLVKIQ